MEKENNEANDEESILQRIEELQYNTEILNIVCTILSFISIIIVFIVFISNPKLRGKFAFRIIMFLLLSDFLHAISMLNTIITLAVSNNQDNAEQKLENNTWCKFNAFLLTLGETSALFWYLNICHFLYSSMVLDKKHRMKHMYIYHGIAYGITLALGIIPFITQDYGPVSYYCWVISEKRNEDYVHYIRFLLFYIPLWVCLTIVSYFNRQVYKLHKKLSPMPDKSVDSSKRKNSTLYTRLLIFSLVLLVYGLIATTHRVLNWVGYEDYQIPIFVYLHNFQAQIIGMVDSIVYGMFKPVRQTTLNLITCGYYMKNKQKNQKKHAKKNPNYEQDDDEDEDEDEEEEEDQEEKKDNFDVIQLENIRQKSIVFNNENTELASNASSIRYKDLSFISIDF